jgi:membrane protease YdiL (CAAX protease family)
VPQHWGFWGTLAWGGVVAASFVALQIATLLTLAQLPDFGAEREFTRLAEDGTLFCAATFVTTAVCCPLILGIIRLKKGSRIREYLALQGVAPAIALRWFGALAIVLMASDLLTLSLGRPIVPDSMSALYASANPKWMFWIALVIAAPLFEELFFRGFLFRGLQSSFVGSTGTIVVTSLVWASIHLQYDAYGIATVFVLGLLLGAARAYAGTLLLPLGMHSVANLVAGIETALAAPGVA